jgi:hypothetical protein
MAGIEHATPNDNDLHGDQNAAHWAERFASRFEVRHRDTRDGLDTNDLMLTWFAGAIETGSMRQQRIVAYSIFGDFYDPKDVNIIRDTDEVRFGPLEDQPDPEILAELKGPPKDL